jgi:hypothetical protein
MQFRFFITILLLAFVGNLEAQVGGVTASLSIPQDAFISGEDIPVTVNIVNQSGRELVFDADLSTWLSFKVDTHEKFFVREIGMVPKLSPLKIPNGTVGKVVVNLPDIYNVSKSAGYDVKGVITFKDWDRGVTTPAATFKIFKGTSLKAFEFGYSPDPKEPPSTFKYILQSADLVEPVSLDPKSPIRNKKRLYVRIADGNDGTLTVFPVCPLLDVSKPEYLLDTRNNLHIFVQTGPSSFTYTTVSPSGKIALRQTHEYDETRSVRPRLKQVATGQVIIYGGNRRLSPSDYPPEKQNAGLLSTNLNASVTN